MINLTELNTQPELFTPEQYEYQNEDIAPLEPLTATDSLKLLREMFPNKALFSLQEAATLLNVSYEYMRSKVASEIIPSTSMGNRKMINIITINKLIIEGS